MELITDISSANAQHMRGVPTMPFPVCVLHDMMGCWAQEAAEQLHIEKYLLYVSPVACLSIGLQSERLEREGRAPVTSRNARHSNNGHSRSATPAKEVPDMYQFAYTFEMFKYNENRNAKADEVLCNSFNDLEKKVIDALRKEVLSTAGVQFSPSLSA